MLISPVGEFGIVYKAHLLPDMQITAASKSLSCPLPQTVAVKTLKGKCHQHIYIHMYCTRAKLCYDSKISGHDVSTPVLYSGVTLMIHYQQPCLCVCMLMWVCVVCVCFVYCVHVMCVCVSLLPRCVSKCLHMYRYILNSLYSNFTSYSCHCIFLYVKWGIIAHNAFPPA